MGSPGRIRHTPQRPRPPRQAPKATYASFLLLSGRDRLDDAKGVEPGALRGERGVGARRRLEHEEADLVFGNVDRPFEANAAALPRQLLGRRPRPSLARGAFALTAASEIRLNEVARHAVDASPPASRWKRQNV